MTSRGNATVAVLILLFALSAIFTASAVFAGSLIRIVHGFTVENDERSFLAEEAQKIISLMADDPTPEADSRLDPVWAEVTLPSTPGLEIKLEDASSRINPNTASDFLMLGMGVLKPDILYEQFHKYRAENGPLHDIPQSCAGYLTEDAVTRLCTEYGFFNVNTADEAMLYRLFEQRTGKKATSTLFPTKLRQSRTSKQFITGKTLKEALGTDIEAVYPFISTVPELNVNLVDADILINLMNIAIHTFKMELNTGIAGAILKVREQSEITVAGLEGLCSPKFKNSMLEQYLGCRTWFWRITLTKSGITYQCIVARVPALPGKDDQPVRFRIVEEIFSLAKATEPNGAEKADSDG